MIAFYLIFAASYLFYTRSKYFPPYLPKFPAATWAGCVLLLGGAAFFIQSDGWAGGLLLWLVAATLAMSLVRLFAVLGSRYFYGLLIALHLFLIANLISYAG